MTTLKRAMLAVVALGIGFTAAADPIVFEYEGVCIDGPAPEGDRVFNCGAIGLESGDPVWGSIEVDESALDDLILTGAEVRNSGAFAFEFGNLSFDGSNSFLSGALALDDAFNIVGGLFNMSNIITAANTLSFTPDGGGLWSARRGFWWAGGLGHYSAISVPEPGTLSLLGLGLLALGFARRRRTQ